MLFRRSDIAASLAKTITVCLAVVLPAICFGCESSGKATGGVTFSELAPATLKPAKGAEVRATAPARSVFAAMAGGESERLVIERPAEQAAGDESYVQKRFLEAGGKQKLIREQHLRLREDGAVVLAEEINHAESVEVVFDPPLVVLPASIEPNATISSEGRMTVHPLGDRSRVRAKGTVKDTSTCVGAFRVSTPAGEFDAWKLTSSFDANLGTSHVLNETEIWVVPGIGLIAERRREKTAVFGVTIRNNTEEWVVVEAPAAAKAGR